MNGRTEFGQWLKQKAQEADLSSVALAHRLGVTPAAVRSWWQGRNEPSIAMLRAYAEAVGVPLMALIQPQTGIASMKGDSPMFETRTETAVIRYIRLTKPNGGILWLQANRILAVESEDLGRRVLMDANGDSYFWVQQIPDEVMRTMTNTREATDE